MCKRRYKGAIQETSSNMPVRMTDIDDKSDHWQEEVSKVEEDPVYLNYTVNSGIEKKAASGTKYDPGNQYHYPKRAKAAAGQYANINPATLSDVNVYDTPKVHRY